MEEIAILFVLGLIVVVVVVPVLALVKAKEAAAEARKAREGLRALGLQVAGHQQELAELRGAMAAGATVSITGQPAAAPAAEIEPPIQGAAEAEPWLGPAGEEAVVAEEPAAVVPPPLPPYLEPVWMRPDEEETAVGEEVRQEAVPPRAVPHPAVARKVSAFVGGRPPVPPQQQLQQPPPHLPQPVVAKSPVSIEQFLGVKLFAWLGGVALFFGVIFFVKYAFERNLIPPAIRVAIGFVAGLGLLGGGLWTQRKPAYQVLAQALCATGVLVLYGVSFAAHAHYRFPAFGPVVTFSLMSLITVTAFLVAVRFNALVVAVLGMVGGFLTPVLLPVVQDQPFALFSYIAVLDVGLLAITWRGRWPFLAIAAAAGTVMMQIGWVAGHFVPDEYFLGSRTLVPMAIFGFFCALFLAAAWRKEHGQAGGLDLPGAAAGVLATAVGFGFFCLVFPDITNRVFLLFGYLLLLNLAAIILAWNHPRFAAAQTAVAGLTFLHLVIWTCGCLKSEMLGSALAVYLVFGALHAVWPVLAQRWQPGRPGGAGQMAHGLAVWLPPVVVALMTLTVLVLPETSFWLWPAVLLADLLAIGLAVASGAVLPVLAALVMTLVAAVAWLFRVPAEAASLPPLLGVVVFFAWFFTAAGVWLAKKVPAATDGKPALPWSPALLLPIASGSMPFALLILMVARLPLASPTPVFGAGLLFALMLLGIAILARQSLLVPTALLGCLALEGIWHAGCFEPALPGTALAWYLVFYALFTVFPFLFRKACGEKAEPWIASALAGAGHFMLVHDLVRRAWPNDMMGLVPAAFAVPSILALLAVWRSASIMDQTTRTRLAWFGGIALLFITLIFPIQFDRQWLTVSWALEGTALIWLFRRVPHPGLRWTGLGLLGISFVRLALNPAVFEAYPRSGTAILNWHLYAYGIVAACQFLGAWWLMPEHRRFQNINVRGVLWILGGVLLFLLLNIEIADYFTAPGNRFVTFEFAGNFARDMTYTISWALFALALLMLGIWFRGRGARLAAIGLLGGTLLKLFFHDLASIGNIYRVAALIVVGVIAFLASFLYQRFFAGAAKP